MLTERSASEGSKSGFLGTVIVSLGLTCILVGAVVFSWYHRWEAPGTAGFESFVGLVLMFVGVGGLLGGLWARSGRRGWYVFVLVPAILAVLYFMVAIELYN